MKKLVVLVGLPGSGKSTEAKKVHDGDWFYYSTDNYIEEVAEKKGMTYSEVFADTIDEATKEMNKGVANAIKNNSSVLWDQTNLTPKKRSKILRRFKDYKKMCFCILPPFNKEQEKELKRRLDGRDGKFIPDHVIESMTEQFVEPTTDEGFDEVYVFNIYGELVKQKIK